MATLGLLPPYSHEDVRRAYKEKVKQTHPDKGGTPEAFHEVTKAYEEAQQYLHFYESRRLWIATQVDRYVQQEEVVQEINRLGGSAFLEEPDWLEQTYGEGFAAIAGKLIKIVLHKTPEGARFLQFLAERPLVAQVIKALDLEGSQIEDESLRSLQGMELLKKLNLANTPVTTKGIAHVKMLPALQEVNIAGTKIQWWARLWLKMTCSRPQFGTTFDSNTDSPMAPYV